MNKLGILLTVAKLGKGLDLVSLKILACISCLELCKNRGTSKLSCVKNLKLDNIICLNPC